VANRARALSDPSQLMLTTALRAGEESCVCDYFWIAGRSQNHVPHHPRALRDRGLVRFRSRRDDKLVMYSLAPAGSSLLGAVLSGPVRKPARRRRGCSPFSGRHPWKFRRRPRRPTPVRTLAARTTPQKTSV
jgi:DNA-binding transcriptional ArsR family regulator